MRLRTIGRRAAALTAVCAFAGWAVVAVLGVRRIDLNGRVLAIILLVEIAVAVVFAVVQLVHPDGGRVTFDTLAPNNLLGAGIGAALVTAVAGFVGFEGTAVFSEESKDPQRTVAKATYRALAIIGLLYAFCAWAMSVADSEWVSPTWGPDSTGAVAYTRASAKSGERPCLAFIPSFGAMYSLPLRIE